MTDKCIGTWKVECHLWIVVLFFVLACLQLLLSLWLYMFQLALQTLQLFAPLFQFRLHTGHSSLSLWNSAVRKSYYYLFLIINSSYNWCFCPKQHKQPEVKCFAQGHFGDTASITHFTRICRIFPIIQKWFEAIWMHLVIQQCASLLKNKVGADPHEQWCLSAQVVSASCFCCSGSVWAPHSLPPDASAGPVRCLSSLPTGDKP